MGISINSLRSRWWRCPDILRGAQDAGPGSGRLRVKSAVQGRAAAFSRTFIYYGALLSRLDRTYRGYP